MGVNGVPEVFFGSRCVGRWMDPSYACNTVIEPQHPYPALFKDVVLRGIVAAEWIIGVICGIEGGDIGEVSEYSACLGTHPMGVVGVSGPSRH